MNAFTWTLSKNPSGDELMLEIANSWSPGLFLSTCHFLPLELQFHDYTFILNQMELEVNAQLAEINFQYGMVKKHL